MINATDPMSRCGCSLLGVLDPRGAAAQPYLPFSPFPGLGHPAGTGRQQQEGAGTCLCPTSHTASERAPRAADPRPAWDP
jgi:hypothetical protein